MDRSIAMLAIGLIFGGGIGFVIAAGNNVTLDGHEHSEASGQIPSMSQDMSQGTAQGGAHAHADNLMLDGDATVPELTIQVLEDVVSGWNLKLDVSNFRFAPENAGLAHVPGEGHAHVYVNGVKIARIYGVWMHIASLPEGAVVEVTLNANDHRQLAVGDQPIKASFATR